MHAHIFRRYKQFAATVPLQIKNQNIGFFIDPIKDTSEFLSSVDGRQWRLRFFIGSAFEQELVVYFDGDETSNQYHLGRACWLDNDGKSGNDAKLVIRASRFLRQSDTLPLAHGRELTSNRTLLADRDGVAYFSDSGDQFKRIVLCQSLALAYTEVLANCMARMTKNVQGNLSEAALELYEAILRFNAAHYFTLPILLDRHELFGAWRVMCEHYHLSVLNQELTQQLSDVAALLKEQREQQRVADEKAHRELQESQRNAAATAIHQQKEREDRKDRQRNFWLSLAGILLTATSLLSLFQLTPSEFSENASAWKKWIWKPLQAQDAPLTAAPLRTEPNGRHH